MKNVSGLSMARDHFLSLVGPDLDSSLRSLPWVCIFLPFFNWPAIVRASCLSGYISKMLWLTLAAVFVMRSARCSLTPEMTAVLWLRWWWLS